MMNMPRLEARESQNSTNSLNSEDSSSSMTYHFLRPMPIPDSDSEELSRSEHSDTSSENEWLVDSPVRGKTIKSFCIQPHGGDTLIRGESMILEIDTGEVNVLSCTICYSKRFEGIYICRFCSSQACKTCWDHICKTNRKCPFCRHKIHPKNLIRNRLSDEIHNNQNIDKQNNTLDKTCIFHSEYGSFFCETCFTFVCLSCIRDGAHTDHDLCDIDKRYELKQHLQKIHSMRKNISNASATLNLAIKTHHKYFNYQNDEFSKVAKSLKKTVISKIDGCLKKYMASNLEHQKSLCRARKDLAILEKAKQKFIYGSCEMRSAEDLKDRILEYLDQKGSTKLAQILREKQDYSPCLKDLEDAYNLNQEDKKHENFLLKFNKSLSDILINAL
ncbi:unnamed protein product [Moneuplotes crassus]|uniref:B box-type domain-containing protein n=1 Tax=Euplotes crassus TaxID=5936 RepID=A0AAD1USN1_EUPCR|nr:unnamed protein product [Moneuplotes crassus]